MIKTVLAASAAFALLPLAAAAQAPVAPLPDFPQHAQPGECWTRTPIAGAPMSAHPGPPAGGQAVWTLKRGHGPEAVWRYSERSGAGPQLMPRGAGGYDWVRVECDGPRPGFRPQIAEAPRAPLPAAPPAYGAGEHEGPHGFGHSPSDGHAHWQHHAQAHGPGGAYAHGAPGPAPLPAPPPAYGAADDHEGPHGFGHSPADGHSHAQHHAQAHGSEYRHGQGYARGYGAPHPLPHHQGMSVFGPPPPPFGPHAGPMGHHPMGPGPSAAHGHLPPPPVAAPPLSPPRWFGDRYLSWAGKRW
jgi:hypothetical protein